LPETKQALDIDVSRHAQIFDPPLDVGAARLRFGVADNTELTVEGNAAALRADDAASAAPRTLYTGAPACGRIPTKPVHVLCRRRRWLRGCGRTFAAVDAGIAVGYQNCVLVPSFRRRVYVGAVRCAAGRRHGRSG
jgi:hypothetical protein